MESQAIQQRQELHRLRMALEALCSTTPTHGDIFGCCTMQMFLTVAHIGHSVQPVGSIMLQQDVHCQVHSVAHGNVHVQQHTIHAARTLATPPSTASNNGHWHIDTQHGMVTVVNISPEPPQVNSGRHPPIAPVRVDGCYCCSSCLLSNPRLGTVGAVVQ